MSKKLIDVKDIIKVHEDWFDFKINFNSKNVNINTFENVKDIYKCLEELLHCIINRGTGLGNTVYELPFSTQNRDYASVRPGWTIRIKDIGYQTNDCLVDSDNAFNFKKVNKNAN